MVHDCLGGQAELLSDLSVGGTGCELDQHIPFARRQEVEIAGVRGREERGRLTSFRTNSLVLLVGRSQPQLGPPVATVGRNARPTNWGLTLWWCARGRTLRPALPGSRRTGPRPTSTQGHPPHDLGRFTLTHLIICGVGVSRAKTGQVFEPPSIPFVGRRW
jgi:hypothetical protein